jgi:hypothetical protein
VYRLAAGAACILVAACAGTVKEGMAKLEGQPLSAVIAKIGHPMGERSVAGKTVYYWGTPELSATGGRETMPNHGNDERQRY